MEKFKVLFAIGLIVAGLVGFYILPLEQQLVRTSILLASSIAAMVTLWFSAVGQRFVAYAKESIKEAQKVVWPSRKETWQMTMMVFVFVAVLALFMWLVDSGLTWLLYDLLLNQQ